MASKKPAPLQTRVGRRLRQLRQARGLTLDQVADHAGYTGKYVGEIERGIRDPSLSTLEAIVERGIGATMFETFSGIAEKSSPAEHVATLVGAYPPEAQGAAVTILEAVGRLARADQAAG